MKKLRFFRTPKAKVGCQEPPSSTRAQPWILTEKLLFLFTHARSGQSTGFSCAKSPSPWTLFRRHSFMHLLYCLLWNKPTASFFSGVFYSPMQALWPWTCLPHHSLQRTYKPLIKFLPSAPFCWLPMLFSPGPGFSELASAISTNNSANEWATTRLKYFYF